MLNNLNIVRDCYWAMPSGDKYLIDENDQLSSQTHGLYTSFNATDTEFVRASNSGEIRYYGRLESNNLGVHSMAATIRAECTPPGSAIVYVNALEMFSIPVTTKADYTKELDLTNEQQQRIFSGRILSNYDYIEVKVNSHLADPASTFRTPDVWMDAGSGVYTDSTKAAVATDGDTVGGWQSRGKIVAPFTVNQDFYVNDEAVKYHPVLIDSVYNGKPGIRFYGAPSGMFLEYYGSPLTSTSGTFVAVVIPHAGTTDQNAVYSQNEAVAGDTVGAYAKIGINHYHPVEATNRYLFFDMRVDNTESNRNSVTLDYVAPSGELLTFEFDQKEYYRTSATWNVNGSGTANLADTTTGRWFGTATDTDHSSIGCNYSGNNPLNVYSEFDGFILEVMAFETPLSSGELVALNSYVYDKYGTHGDYIRPHIKLYDADVAYSGDVTWDNHQAGLPNVITDTYYPTSIKNTGSTAWSGVYTNINMGINDTNVDDTYLECENPGSYNRVWTGAQPMPSGYLSIQLKASGELDPLTTITRAQLLLRMAFPPSGNGDNVKDSFEINGYSAPYKNQDHREELEYVESSVEPIFDAYGYFLYGAGDVVGEEGFKTYTTELNFLDPTQPSGQYASIRDSNADMLANMDFHLIGLPSGTQISAAELQVEYIPNNTLSLYTVGDLSRCAASSTVDAGTTQSYAYGDGGWHHRGWRLRGPTVIEEDVFTNFYSFSEEAGTRTYPETTKAYYFPTGDEDQTVYADYVKLSPRGTVGDTGDVTPYLVEPQRREYYRDPVDTNDLTPSYELPTLRDTTFTQPSYYRHMLYHNDSLGFFDGDLDAVDENSINWNSVSQVHFGDRIGLGPNFTLYFMLYRDYGFQSYGRFFHRGRVEDDGINNYEIYGDLEMDRVRFTVRSTSNLNNKVEVEIDRNSVEPILIWFECGYETVLAGHTTLNLSVHDDVKNFFNTDWKRATKSFSGFRKQYTEQSVIAFRPDGTSYTRVYGGPQTVIGTLEHLTFFEQLSRNIYLHRTSVCEFAYVGTEPIELDYETGTSTTYLDYDVSEEKDKHFFKTRVCNNQYMQANPSGVNWMVPPGSGQAQWSTTYSINDWTENSLAHSLYNPISTAGTNNIVAPSAIFIDMSAAHSTDHPSGVTVYVDLEFDSGTTDKWKVAHAEFNVPSGGTVYLQYEPIDFREAISKHINMDGDVIKYSDVENINVRVTTKYPAIGEDEYYGNFTIHSLNVSFDSYCVAATGLADLDLYTSGSVQTVGSAEDTSLDLFVQGSITVDTPDPADGTQNLDLYIMGYPHLASGDITPLYVSGVRPTDPTVDVDGTAFMPLFVEGFDPPEASGQHPLFIWGTTEPAIRDDMNMFVESNLDPAWMLPLYVDGPTGSGQTHLNLFLGNYPATAESGLSLYAFGPSYLDEDIPYINYALLLASGVLVLADGSILTLGDSYPNTTNLYIKGAGPADSDGYFVKNEDMNLFMARDSEGTAANMTMYMAQHGANGIVNMSITGTHLMPSSVPLFISGSGAPPNSNTDLYTHGF